MRADRRGLLVLIAVLIGGCAGGPPKSRFEREYQRYLSLPNQKAMAVAGDPNGRWVYGYGYGARSSGMAEVSEMEQCNVRRREIGPDAECRIYAKGSRVVWESETTAE